MARISSIERVLFGSIKDVKWRKSDRYAPMISFKPSITASNSSFDAFPIFFPNRSVESTRIWLIFTHDCFGKLGSESSNVNGKPAFGRWLVKTTAMTVPERSLKTS